MTYRHLLGPYRQTMNVKAVPFNETSLHLYRSGFASSFSLNIEAAGNIRTVSMRVLSSYSKLPEGPFSYGYLFESLSGGTITLEWGVEKDQTLLENVKSKQVSSVFVLEGKKEIQFIRAGRSAKCHGGSGPTPSSLVIVPTRTIRLSIAIHGETSLGPSRPQTRLYFLQFDDGRLQSNACDSYSTARREDPKQGT